MNLRQKLSLADNRCAISVSFQPHFPAVRVNNQSVCVVLVKGEAMDRAMWEFAERTGKFFDCLEFCIGGRRVNRMEKVAEVSTPLHVPVSLSLWR